MIDWLQAWFAGNDGFRIAGDVLGRFGMDALKVVLVPLAAMWVLLPLMILTALLFVGALAMPGDRAPCVGAPLSRAGKSAGVARSPVACGYRWRRSSCSPLWIVTLPLNLVPPLIFIVQPALWAGSLTA